MQMIRYMYKQISYTQIIARSAQENKRYLTISGNISDYFRKLTSSKQACRHFFVIKTLDM